MRILGIIIASIMGALMARFFTSDMWERYKERRKYGLL